MNPALAKLTVLIASVLLIGIPAAVHRNAPRNAVVVSRKGPVERVLLALVSLACLLCLIWVATPAVAFAEYSLHRVRFFIGFLFLTSGLVLLYRSHADLGANWSVTLELRERHKLITQGIYGYVRHPMYFALLLYAAGQALMVPNWLAGPAYLLVLALLFAFRIGREEQMMSEKFGSEYNEYRTRTKRIIPWVW